MLSVVGSLSSLAPTVLALVVLLVPTAAASEQSAVRALPTLAAAPVTTPRPAESDQPARVRGAEKAKADTKAMVNINTADVKSLMTLTGVGRKVAEKIVEYRDSHGPFKKPDEIRKVEGVGNGVWERNRERIVTK
jgi:competence protein ComEA